MLGSFTAGPGLAGGFTENSSKGGNTIARKAKLPPGMWQRGQTYYARFSSQGRQVRKRLSTDFATAKLLLNDLMARSDRGDFGYLDNDYPWKELRAAFMTWAKQEIRNPDDYRRDLDRSEEFAGLTNVREITADRIFGYRRWRLDQGRSIRLRRRRSPGGRLPLFIVASQVTFPQILNLECDSEKSTPSPARRGRVVGGPGE